MKIITVLILIIAATVSTARADEDAMTKYRNYTPKQIMDMPEKLRDSTIPMAYIFAAQSGLAVDAELALGMKLNLLMYQGIQDFKAAVKAFQADLGDKPTGALTVYQIYQLDYRSGIQKLGAVLFPNTLGSFKTADYGNVKGAVTILDDRIAWPINYHEIKCYKTSSICEVYKVILDLPNEKSWVQQYQVMVDSIEYYNVVRWTSDTIDAEPPSNPDSCRSTSLSLNFKTKEFFFITKNAGGKCEIMGKKIDKLEKPRIAQVVEGKTIFEKEFERISKIAYSHLASDFRRKVDEGVAKSRKK